MVKAQNSFPHLTCKKKKLTKAFLKKKCKLYCGMQRWCIVKQGKNMSFSFNQWITQHHYSAKVINLVQHHNIHDKLKMKVLNASTRNVMYIIAERKRWLEEMLKIYSSRRNELTVYNSPPIAGPVLIPRPTNVSKMPWNNSSKNQLNSLS